MRILLISANTEKTNMLTLPLGLACVAAASREAGHDVALLDLMAEKDSKLVLMGAIEKYRPEIIGISVRNIDDQNMENPRFLLEPVREIVAQCRSLSDASIVLGGAGYSIFPEGTLSFLGADIGIQGEGELVFPQLLERMEQGVEFSGLPGLYLPGHHLQCMRTFTEHLDRLPLPDNECWPLSAQKEDLWMPVQTRRGCPLECSYCSTATIEGHKIRKHSSEVIAQWIARWRGAGVHQFYFVDNTFNLPLSHAKEVCRKLVNFDMAIRWWSIVYPKEVDEELVTLMARAGCDQVSIGFESGSERILKNMNKRFTVEDVRYVSEILSEYGIKQMGFLLLGSPGETKESVEESLVFSDSLKLDALKITAGVRIYPQTPLARRAIAEGVISSHEDLLFPRFYMANGLEDWLPETLKHWAGTRSHWKMQ